MEKLDFDRLADGRFKTYDSIPTRFPATSPRQNRTPMSARPPLLLAIVAALFGNLLHADDWWQFRGPGGSGDAGEVVVPTKWGGFFDKPYWETTIPGHGWSSPIVVANRIWITTSELVALNEIQSEDKIAKRQIGRASCRERV